MADSSVEVQGAAMLAATLHRAAAQIGDGVGGADGDAATLIAAQARGRAPRRTGTLSGSVRASGPVVSAGAPYAAYVEFGTRYRSATPYLYPTVEQAVPQVETVFLAHATTILNQIKGA